MFGRQERLAILLLLAVTIIVIASHLVLGTIGKRPFASPFTEKSQNGDLVIVSGTIGSVTETRTGGHLIIEIDNTSVFIPSQVAANRTFLRGTNITAMGIVQAFRGKREIAVQYEADIVIIR